MITVFLFFLIIMNIILTLSLMVASHEESITLSLTTHRVHDLEFQVKSLKGKLKKEHDRRLKTKQALNKHLRMHGT